MLSRRSLGVLWGSSLNDLFYVSLYSGDPLELADMLGSVNRRLVLEIERMRIYVVQMIIWNRSRWNVQMTIWKLQTILLYAVKGAKFRSIFSVLCSMRDGWVGYGRQMIWVSYYPSLGAAAVQFFKVSSDEAYKC